MKIFTPSILAILLLLSNGGAFGQDSLVNPVNGFQLTLMRAADLQNGFLGWIELRNGDKSAGFIYIQDGPPMEPHLSSDKTYIVMDMPPDRLGTVLDILRNDRPVSLRFSGAGRPSAFLEVGPRALDSEQRQLISERFGITLAE